MATPLDLFVSSLRLGTPLASLGDSEAMQKFDINKDYDNFAFAHQVLDATDPDLAAFHQRGGKLLMYFGWADPQLNARMGLEYYQDVVAKMGPSTPEFARLFMVPGMFHCGGGIGTSTFDSYHAAHSVGGRRQGAGVHPGRTHRQGSDDPHAPALPLAGSGPVQRLGQHR